MIEELRNYPELKGFPPRKAFNEICKILFAERPQNESRALSKDASLFLALAVFDMEVSNGGFAQYFSNPSGKEYLKVQEALELLRLTKYDGLVRRWLNLLLPEIDPTDPRQVGAFIFSDKSRFERSQKIDMEYYRNKEEFLKEIVEWALN